MERPSASGTRFRLLPLLAALPAAACGGASGAASCAFSILTDAVSPGMATVGVVEWSTTLPNVASAEVVYTLNGAGPEVLNAGGTAPVDLTKPNHRTLLLGLKPSSDYTFHLEARDQNGALCRSPDYALPTTGLLPDAPAISRTAANPAAQAKGFIVTSSGVTYGNYAIVIDADGAVVWYAPSPNQCSRARLDYEGANMWMVSVNEDNSGGEMRFVSLDGQTTVTNVVGLANAHHDFAVLPGKIAALVWVGTDTDAPSELVEMSSDGSGSPATMFAIGPNLYVGSTAAGTPSATSYHANSILYHVTDDSFTIGDRYPNLYVKVSQAGALQWQFGGSCAGAPAGAARCVAEGWKVNHGHHLLDDGTMLVFNNGTDGRPSEALEFQLDTAGATMTATSLGDLTSGGLSSNVLGDVQRLPNGNTLITYSTAGEIVEVDAAGATVQTLTGSYGYADWRPTLYGP
ncbi:MAG TPA: arylsulfotransferase family protein, partial [Polyangia bacterium]|nr:arylsulfotransferase family protein [Polyangia bacterium]